MRIHTLQTEILLPRPVEAVFAFFSDPHNLNAITPPWLHFNVLTPSGTPMQEGAVLEYRLRWRWVPLRWRTAITAWEPPHRFVDAQISGPYRQWIHEHTFSAQDSGTLMHDRVDYALPGRIVEPLLHRLLVGHDVRGIFEFRQRKMLEIFGG